MALSTLQLLLLCVVATAVRIEPSRRVGLGGPLPTSALPKHSSMEELVLPKGYQLEPHYVTTADGYVLGVFRIPRGSAGRHARRARAATIDAACARPVVLLQHGLLESSATWVLNDADQSLGFILADDGYDVWMSNSRGNAFSRNHTGLDPGQPAFWEFSLDEMAEHDLPAVADYVARASGCSRFAYVGHSQGAAIAMAGLSLRTTLRGRLSVAVLLAPAAYLGNVASVPLLALAGMHADELFRLLGASEFLPSRYAASELFHDFCTGAPPVCVSVLTAIAGFNPANVNASRLPQYVQYSPSGTSVANMAHWAQLVRRGAARTAAGQAPWFGMYDYGSSCVGPTGLPRTCNMRMYHSADPPQYNLSGIDVPLAVFSGGLDKLADPADVDLLVVALPRGALAYLQHEPFFEHIDFTWGVTARYRIYPEILRLLTATLSSRLMTSPEEGLHGTERSLPE